MRTEELTTKQDINPIGNNTTTILENEKSPQAFCETEQDIVVSTEKLEVNLTFQLGSVDMSFKDLKNINPGYVFELEKRLLDQPISIMANGSLLAEGELVCIGEFIGVRISSIKTAAG